MIKVLQVHGGMERAGTEAVIMSWYRNINRDEVEFDFTSFTKKKCSYDDEIESLGGNIIYVPGRLEVGSIKHIIALYKAIKENGPYDVVHTHMNFHGGIVALVAKLAGVKKVVCHAHNTSDSEMTLKRKIEQKFLGALINIFSDKRYACSTEAGLYVFKNKKNFELINNAVDQRVFKPVDELTQDSVDQLKNQYHLKNKLILGHIGRFDIQKNHEFIIKIARDLKKVKNDFVILLIGTGSLEDSIKQRVKDDNLEENILFLGMQLNTDIWLNVMDVFIFPSLFEGLPVVLIEAQSAGLPCIISNKISSEVDMDLDLITFLDINKETDLWIESVLNIKDKIRDVNYINNKISEKGYNLQKNVKKLVQYYK